MSQTALFNYGCETLHLYKSFRFITYIENSGINHIKDLILTHLGVSLIDHHVETVYRETIGNFNMKWHMDDRVIVKHKGTNIDSVETFINSKYKLIARQKKIPEFTYIPTDRTSHDSIY